MFKKNNHNFSFIQNNKELNEFIEKIKKKKIFFLDTEFERRSTYKAIISYVVIYDGKNIGIIDCLEKKNQFKKIYNFLNHKKNTLVIHSHRQDLEIFLSTNKKILFSVFDTQVAALIDGYKEIPSYKKLVLDLCGVQLDKSLQKKNWLERPITNEQTNYLINDVYYLKIIFEKLKRDLIRKKKINLFNKLIKKEIYKLSYENYPIIYKKKLGEKIYANKKFLKLISFREKIAKKLNLPKNWVLSDKHILKNIKSKKIFITSKHLKNNEIKILTVLIENLKKNISVKIN
jgi:ribonuclease D